MDYTTNCLNVDIKKMVSDVVKAFVELGEYLEKNLPHFEYHESDLQE